MIMGRETSILVSDCLTNTQSDTIHSKTQTDIHEQEKQFNKAVPKKSMIQ
jgi:hypothetical protein